MNRFLLAFAVALAGCYVKTPPKRPTIDLPELAGDKQLSVVNGSERRHHGYEYRDVPVTMVGYGDDPVSRGELIRMTTPDWDARAAEYDAKRARCQRSQLPRAVATALVAGSLVFFLYGTSVVEDPRTRLYASLAGWGGGLVVYGGGYVVGGKICNGAAELYNRYYRDAGDHKFYLDEEIKRVNQLVRNYNLKHPVTTATPD